MKIPNEAIEAAAEIIINRIDAAGYVEVADLSNVTIDVQDFDLRAALEAAGQCLVEAWSDDILDEKARRSKEEWLDERA